MILEKLLSPAILGSRAVLYALMLLSVLSIGMIIERMIYFRKRRTDTKALGRSLLTHLRAGDLSGAKAVLLAQKSIEAGVLGDVLDWYDAGPEALGEAIQSGLTEKRRELESGLVFLGTLGNNAPFLGLFGTVLGIVTAFRELGQSTASAMGTVMSGIAEALIATALGILVALPAVVAFNVFQRKVIAIEENVQSIGHLILAELRRKGRVSEKRAPSRTRANGSMLQLAEGPSGPMDSEVEI